MARPGLEKHPKFKKLCRLLGVTRPHALGYLECLWGVAYENGNALIGDAADVEAAAEWDGEAGKLCDALLSCRIGAARYAAGFIEESPDCPGLYQIHDLTHHAPDYVASRAEKEAQRRALKICEYCGTTYKSSESHSKFCKDACRQADYRRRTAEQAADSATESVTQDGQNVTDVTRRYEPPAPAPAPLNTNTEASASSSKALRAPKLRFTDDDMAIALEIFAGVRRIHPNAREPAFNTWANHVRLMRENDGADRTPEGIRSLFAWANRDSFWGANILSPQKLREKWDQLSTKRNGVQQHGKPRAANPGQRFDPDADRSPRF